MIQSSNVRILVKSRYETVYDKYGLSDDIEVADPGPWLVVYNRAKQRWIVTNAPEDGGLFARAEDIMPIGFGETLNSALFVVYEHQKLQGLHKTIQDDLRAGWEAERSVAIADASEWDWDWGKGQKPEFRPMIMNGMYNPRPDIVAEVMERIERLKRRDDNCS